MNLFVFLGVFGPWQLIAILLFLCIIKGEVILVVKLTSPNYSDAVRNQSTVDPLDKLSELNKLK